MIIFYEFVDQWQLSGLVWACSDKPVAVEVRVEIIKSYDVET